MIISWFGKKKKNGTYKELPRIVFDRSKSMAIKPYNVPYGCWYVRIKLFGMIWTPICKFGPLPGGCV